MPIFRLLAWIAPLVLLALVSLRVFGLERGFPLVPLIAYTPWFAPAALLAAAVAAILGARRAAALALLVAAVTAAVVAPRLLADGTGPVGGGTTLQVMSLNMYWGAVDADELVDAVADERVDLLSLQEIDADVLAALDAAGLREQLPQRIEALGNGKRSTAIYSRLTLSDSGRLPGIYKAMARAQIKLDGGRGGLSVVAVHTAAPVRGERIEVWEDDLRALPEAPVSGPPRLLLGDFNATLDHAEFRHVLGRGYRDAADATGRGLASTWPAGSWRPKVAIDHIVADRRVGIADFRTREIRGSDHRAVLARLTLPRV